MVTNIDLLYEKAKNYAELNIELAKLRAIEKTADIVSSILSKLMVSVGVIMFFLFLNISFSLYLGDVLGKDYLGFLVVSGIYLLITILLNTYKNKLVKLPVTNLIIAKLLEKKLRSNISNSNQNGIL